MLVRLAFLALLTAAGSAAPLQGQEPIAVTLLRGICDTIGNTHECAQAIETRQLARSVGRAQRVRGVLQLRLDNGRQLPIADDTTAEWPSWFSYLGYLAALGYYVLWEQHPEGSSIRVVNARNGWDVSIDDMPVVSPDRKRFVTASLDLDAAYNPNRLAIWRVPGDTLVQEWSLSADDWGPDSVSWLSSTSLRFVRMAQAQDFSLVRLTVDTARLGRAGWRVRGGR